MSRSRSSKTKTTKRMPTKGISKVSSAALIPPSEQIERTLPTPHALPKACHTIQRQKANQAMALKAEGVSYEEIAKAIGYKNAHGVADLLYDAGKKGWLAATPDVDAHLTYITAHKIVRNVDKQLDGEDLTEQQHKMTIAAARGRGLFKQYEEGKAETSQGQMLLAVKVEIVGEKTDIKSLPAENVGGRPAYLEGQVAEAQ